MPVTGGWSGREVKKLWPAAVATAFENNLMCSWTDGVECNLKGITNSRNYISILPIDQNPDGRRDAFGPDG
jgi:hypothetical protein